MRVKSSDFAKPGLAARNKKSNHIQAQGTVRIIDLINPKVHGWQRGDAALPTMNLQAATIL
jgi:hypothetical protein